MLGEYQLRIGECELARQFELYIANAAVALSDDCEPVPCITEAQPWGSPPRGPDPEHEAAFARAQARFGADAIMTSMPGRDLSRGRLVGLNRKNAPEFWAAHERVQLERSEYSLAVRTFFRQLQRRR